MITIQAEGAAGGFSSRGYQKARREPWTKLLVTVAWLGLASNPVNGQNEPRAFTHPATLVTESNAVPMRSLTEWYILICSPPPFGLSGEATSITARQRCRPMSPVEDVCYASANR